MVIIYENGALQAHCTSSVQTNKNSISILKQWAFTPLNIYTFPHSKRPSMGVLNEENAIRTEIKTLLLSNGYTFRVGDKMGR